MSSATQVGLQAALRHKSLAMVTRYARLNTAHSHSVVDWMSKAFL